MSKLADAVQSFFGSGGTFTEAAEKFEESVTQLTKENNAVANQLTASENLLDRIVGRLLYITQNMPKN